MSGKTPYTPELRQQVVSAARSYGNATEAGREFGVSEATARRWAKEDAKQAPVQPTGHIPPVVLDKKFSELDIWQALSAMRGTQAVVHAAENGQHEVSITIQTDRPIVLVPTGDWHLGSYATDYESYERHLRYILETPHLYMIDLGDEIDNFHRFKSLEAVLNQALPPKVQKVLLEKVLAKLVDAGKILARCWGNHGEEFDERAFGGSIDRFNDLVPYLKDDGRLHLTVGETVYELFVKHNFRGSSMHHVNHGAKRALRMEWFDADILLSGHTHNGPEFDLFLAGDRHRLAMKTPAYKSHDVYSRRHYGKSQIGLMGVVLFPRQKKFIPFERVEDAVRYRDACS